MLSFAVSPFTSPTYNLPVFLFGLYVQESQEASHLSLQAVSPILSYQPLCVLNQQPQFSGLLAVSALFDILWFTQNTQSALIRLFSIIIFFLKVNALAQLFIQECSCLDQGPNVHRLFGHSKFQRCLGHQPQGCRIWRHNRYVTSKTSVKSR